MGSAVVWGQIFILDNEKDSLVQREIILDRGGNEWRTVPHRLDPREAPRPEALLGRRQSGFLLEFTPNLIRGGNDNPQIIVKKC